MRAAAEEPVLVGRQAELEHLRAALLVARLEGRGRVAVVEGEAGIGKTRLVSELLAWAEGHGFEVLSARCHELESERPFGVLVDALDVRPDSPDPDRADLGRLLFEGMSGPDEPLPASQTPELRFRVVEAMVFLLEQLSLSRPVVLALEDLHWADPSSLLVLDRLCRRVHDLRLALVATRRPLPHPRALELVVAAAAEQDLHLVLPPLDEAMVAELATELLGAQPGDALLATLGRAGGNPLFVEELVDALRREGAITLADGRAEVTDLALPPSLRLTVLRRLSFLSEATLAVLHTASVLGSAFPASDLAIVLGRRGSDLLPLLEEAVEAGLLTGAGPEYSFRHDVVREAIYHDLPPALRRALHVEAGKALAASGSPARRVATHMALGASQGDAEAVHWLLRAGREVAPSAPSVAVGFLQRARELAAEDDGRRLAIGVELVRSLLWSGHLAEAEDLGRELLAGGPEPELAGTLRYALGRALVYSGRLADSIAEVEKALEEPRLPEGLRARLLGDLSLRKWAALDPEGAESAAADARLLGKRLGDDLVLSTAYCGSAWTAELTGRPQDAVELARAALAHAELRVTEAVQRVQARLYLGRALIMADELEDALEVLAAGRKLADELGTVWAQPLFATLFGLHAYIAGAWDDALAESQTALVLADEIGTRIWLGTASGVLALVHVQRDEFSRAEEVLDAAERELGAPGRPRADLERLSLARALLLEARGDAGGALSVLDRAWDLNADAGALGEYRELGPELVRLALVEGAHDRAQAVTETVEDAAGRAGLASSRRAALRCRGLLEDDAAVLLEAATLAAESRPVELTSACIEAGLALASAGRTAEAVAQLHEAVALCESLGAARQLARADSELRRLGVRRGARGTRARPLRGWASLTDSELRIATLVAEGLSNPQIAERLFISRRTVETHVSHILRKLEVASRVQLAAEAARRSNP